MMYIRIYLYKPSHVHHVFLIYRNRIHSQFPYRLLVPDTKIYYIHIYFYRAINHKNAWYIYLTLMALITRYIRYMLLRGIKLKSLKRLSHFVRIKYE